jgi:hypothetical protein
MNFDSWLDYAGYQKAQNMALKLEVEDIDIFICAE